MNVINIFRLIKMDISSKASRYLLFIVFGIGLLVFYFFNYDFSLLSVIDSVSGRNTNNYQSFINNQNFTSSKFHLTWFPKIFLLVSSIITSIAFSEYSIKESKIFHLTIPSNPLEKWISKFIISVVFFPVLFLLIYQAFALLSYRWDSALPFHVVALNLTDPFVWKHTAQIIAIQGIILYGAVLFRKYSFFKTILAVGIISIMINFILMVSITILRDDINLFVEGGLAGLTSLEGALHLSGFKLNDNHQINLYEYYGLSKSIILYITSAVCLLLSYLKFKELEV